MFRGGCTEPGNWGRKAETSAPICRWWCLLHLCECLCWARWCQPSLGVRPSLQRACNLRVEAELTRQYPLHLVTLPHCPAHLPPSTPLSLWHRINDREKLLVTIEAEIGGMQSPVKECQGLPTNRKARETWNEASFSLQKEPSLLTLWFYTYTHMFFKDKCVCLFLTGLGLHCCEGFSLAIVSRGSSAVEVWGLLMAVVFLVVRMGSRAHALRDLPWVDSLAVVPKLNSCGPWVQWLQVWTLGSSQTRDLTCVSCIGRQIVYYWATREALNIFIYLFGCTRS